MVTICVGIGAAVIFIGVVYALHCLFGRTKADKSEWVDSIGKTIQDWEKNVRKT